MKLWRLSWGTGMKQKLDKEKIFQRTFKGLVFKNRRTSRFYIVTFKKIYLPLPVLVVSCRIQIPGPESNQAPCIESVESFNHWATGEVSMLWFSYCDFQSNLNVSFVVFFIPSYNFVSLAGNIFFSFLWYIP